MNRPPEAVAGRIAGIREDLPAGERVLWQGSPRWRALARDAFHLHQVAAYFALLCLASTLLALHEGRPPSAGLLPAAFGASACGLLALLAWMNSRATIYAITSGRVFMRIGIAVPISVNLPLARIDSAGLALRRDGTGDLPLEVEPAAHLAWLHLWPHVRPWQLRHPEPMLRGVPDARHVAAVLASALREAHGRRPRGPATASAPAAPAATLACQET